MTRPVAGVLRSTTSGESAYFLAVNRNKLSVALDLDLEADRGVLLHLLAGADVVADNFLPGTLERRGLDPLALLRSHPRLIWCTLTGFDSDPSRPGYDFVVQAESGWMAITGEPEGDPMKVGVALADVVAGKDAAVAILGSLLGRATERSAEDRRLTVSLAHSATAALGERGAERAGRAAPSRCGGETHILTLFLTSSSRPRTGRSPWPSATTSNGSPAAGCSAWTGKPPTRDSPPTPAESAIAPR